MPRIVVRKGAFSGVYRALDISRAELARRMGIDTGTAYRVELEKTDPSPRFIASLMLASGRKFEELFDIVQDAA